MPHDESITLRPITAANWRACADLDVLDHQRSWLPSNLLSIAASQFYPDNFCRAVYAGERLVGFGMYGIEQTTNRIKVFRLMIDRAAQRQGYGLAAMRVMLDQIAERWPESPVYVSYQCENIVACQMYNCLGFSEVERVGSKITACKTKAGKLAGSAA